MQVEKKSCGTQVEKQKHLQNASWKQNPWMGFDKKKADKAANYYPLNLPGVLTEFSSSKLYSIRH